MLQSGKNQLVVVAYDISADKRRRKVASLLESYGLRMNYSVFECFLTNEKINILKNELQKIINKKNDSILIYYLCAKCVAKYDRMGLGNVKEGVVKVL